MAGQILGDRYQVERQIGKQTGRWTLLARDLQTQELVALKLLFIDEELEWDDLKLFEREVDILKSLSHPSIPRYLGYFEHQLSNAKALVLVRSFVEGISLGQCLQQGRVFTEAETKQLAKGLLGILTYLHERKPSIIHRDIKPSNILLANRQLYLIDFGSVKLFATGDTTAFTVVGTYGYMPPEQFSGRAIPASDLFSLGATLIALITGTHPSSLPRAGSKIDLSQIPNLSPEFADWLGWLCESNLERRAKSAPEALHALEHGRQQPAPSGAAAIAPVKKPDDSKITLSKHPTFLEIVVPSRIGQLQLQIDQQQLSLTTKRLGLQTGKPQIALRKDLTKLEYHKPAAANSERETDPWITLWTANQKIELKGASFSTAEFDWLAYELSTWLKMPISRSG